MSDHDRQPTRVIRDRRLRRGQRLKVLRLKKLRLALILGGLSLLALVSTVFGMMMAVASDLPALENRTEFTSAQNSILKDVNGEFLGRLTDNGRVIVKTSDIALTMQHAIIAIEDRRFYENSGVDIRGVARAFVQDVLRRRAAQGGSTITQQFVKNAMQAQDRRTVLEKLREAALAYHLTRKWSKDKILTEYLNSVYFGNGAYGVEAAARTYFGDDVNHHGCGGETRPCAKELKPEEAALLAGIVASPTAYDPVAHPIPAKRRRNLVLHDMLAQGYLNQAEYARATAEALPAKETIHPPRVDAVDPSAAYFTSWVRQQLIERYGARRALEGGLRVRTTLDLGLQRAAEAAVQKWLGPVVGPSAALVAIDNNTGEVRAMIGGSDYADRPFNLATQGRRQPGSAFKPFVLATALRAGVSPQSTWASHKLVINVPNSTERFTVNNYDDAYAGVTTLARATTFSDNSVYAQVGIKVGNGKIARTAERLGIRTPVSHNYANSLGGLKHGVTVIDMAHAYESLATGGELVTGSLGSAEDGPVGIRRVTLRSDDKHVLARNRPERIAVLPRNVAQETTRILASVVQSGTGRAASLGTVPAWGKTGTTENYGDAWFVGSAGRLTVAVWVGYPDGLRAMKTEYRGAPVAGGTYPAVIWRDFMLSALQAEQHRLEAFCARAAAGPQAATPPQQCVAAGLARDSTVPVPTVTGPTGATGPSKPAKTPPADTKPATPGTDETTPPTTNDTGTGGVGEGEGGGAVPPPSPPVPTPATPPAPVPPPATTPGAPATGPPGTGAAGTG